MDITSIGSAVPPPTISGTASNALRDTSVVRAAAPLDKLETATPVASKDQVSAAVNSVKTYIEPINNALEFSLNDDTDQIVVKIVDRETKEVIRQMPSEEMIALAKALDSLKGLFVKQNA